VRDVTQEGPPPGMALHEVEGEGEGEEETVIPLVKPAPARKRNNNGRKPNGLLKR